MSIINRLLPLQFYKVKNRISTTQLVLILRGERLRREWAEFCNLTWQKCIASTAQVSSVIQSTKIKIDVKFKYLKDY